MDQTNEFRVSKNTTARKNTVQSGMVTVREVAATKAAHDAYVSSMTEGYEEEIGTLKAQHVREIETIKAAHFEAQQHLRTTIQLNDSVIAEQQQEAVSAAIAKAKTEHDAELQVMRRENAGLRTERHELNEKIDRFKAAAKKEVAKYKRELEEEQDRTSKLKLAHQAEIKKLQPFIAIELTVKCKNRKPRTYFRRPATDLLSLTQDYCKEVGRASSSYTWSHKGKPIPFDQWFKTLSNLGIEDGDEIWVTVN